MKKMLLATALALLITRAVLNRRLLFKQTGGSSTKGNHHPSFRFWNWAEETVDAAKICGGAEALLKQTQQTFVNGLLSGFITLGIYTPLEAHYCIAHNNCMSCLIWATLSALLINILLGSFQLFLHSDQPLSPRGEIIPFSGVCQSGEAALSRRKCGSFTLTDRLL